MSAINRYNIIKQIHNDYLIIFVTKKDYQSFGIDQKILNKFNIKNNLIPLKKQNINYLLIDNLEIIEKYQCIDNQYDKEFYLTAIKAVLNKFIG